MHPWELRDHSHRRAGFHFRTCHRLSVAALSHLTTEFLQRGEHSDSKPTLSMNTAEALPSASLASGLCALWARGVREAEAGGGGQGWVQLLSAGDQLTLLDTPVVSSFLAGEPPALHSKFLGPALGVGVSLCPGLTKPGTGLPLGMSYLGKYQTE